MNENGAAFDAKLLTPAEIVCFGTITPASVLVIDEWPEHNAGTLVKEYRDFIADDAAVIACLLRGWDVRSGIIGTALGDDHRGRWVAHHLKSLGVLGEVRLEPQLTTPFEVNISDRTGDRTYFWQRKSEVLATLDTADISLLQGSCLLYVDWYDGDRILRPMREAHRLGIPIFLNLEYGHQQPEILARYAGRATICQAVTDDAQRGDESPIAVARKLLKAGVEIAIVTLAGEGCLVVRNEEILRVWAAPMSPVDGCGAGATFSAGFMYGYRRGWNLEQMARFATAAASLKVAQVGLKPPHLTECKKLAASLKVKHLGNITI